jgi:hypothetical protein
MMNQAARLNQTRSHAAPARAPWPERRLRRLIEQRDPAQGDRLASHLATALDWMTSFERTELVADWSTSQSGDLRLAIARVLAHSSSVVGSLSAIEHLASDPDPGVRMAIARAAGARAAEAPVRLDAVLARLSGDRDGGVRQIALEARLAAAM